MAKYMTKQNGTMTLFCLAVVIGCAFFRKSVVEGHGGGGGGGGGHGGGGGGGHGGGGGGRGGGGRGGGGRGGGGWVGGHGHGHGYGPGVGAGGGAIAFNPLYYGTYDDYYYYSRPGLREVYYVDEPILQDTGSYSNPTTFWQGFLGGSFIVVIIIAIYNIVRK